jgi:hypothetical protein
MEAVRAVIEGEVRNAFALIRPPGHHAGTNGRALTASSAGFCILNNIAVAAMKLIKNLGFQRVLILDFDCHHGNGTQEIFYNSRKVMYVSLHQDGRTLYPGTGSVEEIGDREIEAAVKFLGDLKGLRDRARGYNFQPAAEACFSIQAIVENIQQLKLLARYNRIPYLLKIESAQGTYDAGKIIVENLKGTVGQSSFSEISAQINLKGPPHILVPSGKSSIMLEEIYAWLTSLEKFQSPFTRPEVFAGRRGLILHLPPPVDIQLSGIHVPENLLVVC